MSILVNIIKKRGERLICTLFNKQKVTLGDAIKRLSDTLSWIIAGLAAFLIYGFFAGVIISGFLDMFNLMPASVSAARSSMSMLGIIVFTSLYGAIICASALLVYQLTHIHARKIANTVSSTVRNISNIKLAEDTKRKP